PSCRRLTRRFLNVVLADVPRAGSRHLAKSFSAEGLRGDHDRDVGRASPGSRCGRRYPGDDGLIPLRDRGAHSRHQGRTHRPALRRTASTSSIGKPMMLLRDPCTPTTKSPAPPWMAYAPALSNGSPLETYSAISLASSGRNTTPDLTT